MIDLATTTPTLARFVRDLEAQAPRVLTAREADTEGAAPAAAEAAWLGWAARIVDEHRSVVVFSELLGHLASAGAPYAALCAVQRLLELRHVRLCAEVAALFGPLDALAIDLDDLALPPSSEPPAARALAIVARELDVAEGESVAVLRAYRDAASDVACREALSILLADEARHYATGRHLFDRLAASLDRRAIAPALEALPALMRRDAVAIREAHRRGATGGPGRRFGVSIRACEAPPSIVHLAA